MTTLYKNMKSRRFLLHICLIGGMWVAQAGDAAAYNRRTAIVEAVEKVLPAVVNISTTKKVTVGVSPFPFRFRSPFFDELFEQKYNLSGLGSGLVVEGGYVVTNNHVIAYDFGPADKIYVTFHGDNTTYEAVIVGADPVADIAILRIEGNPPQKNLPWGRSDDLMIGETVIAIGNALGQPFTVTDGIISALHRSIEDDKGRHLYNLIQTNSDINRGNSGGPLVNINGEFIGLNTAILSPTGGSIGVGFAIPVSRVKKVYDYWVANILSLEDQIGLDIYDLTPSLERFFRTNYPSLANEKLEGVVVVEVSPAGFCSGNVFARDIIHEVDGKPVRSSESFLSRLEEHKGNMLTLAVIREGKRMAISIKVPDQEVDRYAWLGMDLQELDSPWKRRYNIENQNFGLVVLSVQPDSAAAKANIRRGDIITSIEKKELKKLDDLKTMVRSLRTSETIVLEVYRLVDTRWGRYLLRMKNTQLL
jgi:serine protease Do/serine protease DegQ